ncbi:MAG: YgiT-type zinc finger protein, partial [Anaerolineales bacterium]
MTEPTHSEVKCSHCTSGSLQACGVTLVRKLGRHWLTIPNFAAWRCDVCGRVEYDAQAWIGLTLVLEAHSKRVVR